MAEKVKQQAKTVYKTGYLQKRQRGKHIKRETQRKKLKFQERYCELNEDGFVYSKKQNSKIRGSFLVERITIVNNTDPQKAFPKGTLTKPELCFQVGDEKEVLYLVASNEELKKEWMDAFMNAAQEKHNEMLLHYHSGVYGSKVSDRWTCCDQNGYDTPGCKDATQTSNCYTFSTFNSVASETTLISDSATGSSLRYSSSCDSCITDSSAGQHNWFEPVVFDDSSDPILMRPRADTDESGIEENKLDKDYLRTTRRPLLSTASSDNDGEYVTCQRYSSEDSIHKDEGIEPDVKRGNEQRKEDVEWTKMKENKHGEPSITHKGVPTSNQSFYLTDSHKLSHSPTALVLHQSTLVSGNGMLQIWDTSPDLTLNLSLKLAGQAFSFDVWKDYVAVGSSVVQLIQLNLPSEPQRILYAKAKDKLQSALDPHFLVSFIGEDGHLATAKVGGSTVDIWPPPPSHSQVVLSPKFSFNIDDNKVLSLTASKNARHPWVATVTEIYGLMKLYILDWKASTVHASLDLTNDDHYKEKQNTFSYLSHVDELDFLFGKRRKLSLLNGQTGNILHSIILGEGISTFSHVKGRVAIGTKNGEVKIFTDDNLTEIYNVKDERITAPVGAIALATDCSRLYVAHDNGVVNIWNDDHYVQKGSQNFQECVVGMQLCSEMILSRRKVFHLDGEESLSVTCGEDDVHLQLPSEVLQYTNPSLEVAFAPLGPVGAHFIFPDGMIPVSPAVWLCFSPQREFHVPAIVKLPHCFECTDLEDSKCLHFLKAEHEDITRDERGQSVIAFKKMDRSQFEIHQDSQYCTLKEHHFCMYCLAVESTSVEKNIIGKVNYCLTILKPRHYRTDKTLRIYCILHFNLKKCKELVQEQTPDDYDTVEKLLQFQTGRYESALEIKVDMREAIRQRWAITLESERKIYAEDVNFFNYRNTECLTTACKTSDTHRPYPYAYPPRFVLEVSAKYANCYSTITLEFTGARRDLSTEIQLHPVRTEGDLVVQKGGGHEDNNHRPADRPISINGMWPSGESTAL